jgi:hypothetical protein
MLHPQDSSTREQMSLNGLWKFALDKATESRSDAAGAKAPDQPPKN